MIRFDCDYTEGAHPRIIEALSRTNFEQNEGYGNDAHCQRARQLIKDQCGGAEVDVHFLVGGTQTNYTVIDSVLRPYQGVLCPETGHINCHETGAVEATGHKVIALPAHEGKISAQQIENAYLSQRDDASFEHLVQPGMVYISLPTEYGTMYSKNELEEISQVCRKCGLPLFVDGARLGYGLAADSSMSISELARLCDVFYIGGTKVGMLFGEAVVIVNDGLKRDFRYMMKQKGAMLAKGRLLGVQFETMFEDGLYYEVSRHAVDMAMRVREALEKKNIPFLFQSPTNQQFPILTHEQQKMLYESFALCYWQPVDENRDAVRICTSWATTEENLASLINSISKL